MPSSIALNVKINSCPLKKIFFRQFRTHGTHFWDLQWYQNLSMKNFFFTYQIVFLIILKIGGFCLIARENGKKLNTSSLCEILGSSTMR